MGDTDENVMLYMKRLKILIFFFKARTQKQYLCESPVSF